MTIASKNKEIARLQDELKTILATRQQLEDTGKADLQIFSTNITAIASIWQQAQLDAIEVRKWLEDSETLMKKAKAAGDPAVEKVNDRSFK
jgi:hypothetical protein